MTAADRMATLLARQSPGASSSTRWRAPPIKGTPASAAPPTGARCSPPPPRNWSGTASHSCPSDSADGTIPRTRPSPSGPKRPTLPRPPRTQSGPRAWVPQLSRLVALPLTAGDHALLDLANTLLRDHPDAAHPSPRALLRTLGEEKYLHGIERHRLVIRGNLNIAALLRARPSRPAGHVLTRASALAAHRGETTRWADDAEGAADLAMLLGILITAAERRPSHGSQS